jgi:hypothetical protein
MFQANILREYGVIDKFLLEMPKKFISPPDDMA